MALVTGGTRGIAAIARKLRAGGARASRPRNSGELLEPQARDCSRRTFAPGATPA